MAGAIKTLQGGNFDRRIVAQMLFNVPPNGFFCVSSAPNSVSFGNWLQAQLGKFTALLRLFYLDVRLDRKGQNERK